MFLPVVFSAFLVLVPGGDSRSYCENLSRFCWERHRYFDPRSCLDYENNPELYIFPPRSIQCGLCKDGYLETDRGDCRYVDEEVRELLLNARGDQKRGPSAKDPVEEENNIDKGAEFAVKNKKNKTAPPAPSPLPPQHRKAGGGAGVPGHGMSISVFAGILAACGGVGVIGIIVAAVCWYNLEKKAKAPSEVDYPAYGVTGPTSTDQVGSPSDRKLAQSAQMYHYQHQKQQMIALEKAGGEMKHDDSDDDSEEENEEGDYTVYECPGLAPAGEMEVKNPLFSEDTAGPDPGKKDGKKDGSAS